MQWPSVSSTIWTLCSVQTITMLEKENLSGLVDLGALLLPLTVDYFQLRTHVNKKHASLIVCSMTSNSQLFRGKIIKRKRKKHMILLKIYTVHEPLVILCCGEYFLMSSIWNMKLINYNYYNANNWIHAFNLLLHKFDKKINIICSYNRKML